MTDRIDEIRKRCDAATPGPWEKVIWVDKTTVENAKEETICWTELCYSEAGKDQPDKNADFIAASREDIPYLLGVIEQKTLLAEAHKMGSQAAIDIWRKQLREIQQYKKRVEEQAKTLLLVEKTNNEICKMICDHEVERCVISVALDKAKQSNEVQS